MTIPLSTQAEALLTQATRYVQDILTLAIEHTCAHRALVIFDCDSELAITLTELYRRNLVDATFIAFDPKLSETILNALSQLTAKDLVVLIQSGSFRLNAFRLRVELFKQGIKVIEHPHLARMTGQQIGYYLDSLAYDPNYYRRVGAALKSRIDTATHARIDSGCGAQLHFSGRLELAKLNVGDYRTLQNVGGQFPIGEVFTEAQDLLAVHGRVRIFVFGDTRFSVNEPPQPITLEIEQGRVVGTQDSTAEFDLVLAQIRAEEGEIWLRELGFGLNRAFSQHRKVDDIGTYERMCGIHLSLGAKHGSYTKPEIRRVAAKYHVDVFAVTEQVLLADEVVYRDGAWCV